MQAVIWSKIHHFHFKHFRVQVFPTGTRTIQNYRSTIYFQAPLNLDMISFVVVLECLECRFSVVHVSVQCTLAACNNRKTTQRKTHVSFLYRRFVHDKSLSATTFHKIWLIIHDRRYHWNVKVFRPRAKMKIFILFSRTIEPKYSDKIVQIGKNIRNFLGGELAGSTDDFNRVFFSIEKYFFSFYIQKTVRFRIHSRVASHFLL